MALVIKTDMLEIRPSTRSGPTVANSLGHAEFVEAFYAPQSLHTGVQTDGYLLGEQQRLKVAALFNAI